MPVHKLTQFTLASTSLVCYGYGNMSGFLGKRIAEGPEDWSKIIGDPDDWDKKNLMALINKFAVQTFDVEGTKITGKAWIELEVADARRSHGLDGTQPGNDVGKKTKDMHVYSAIPTPLHNAIQQSYPTIFRDKKHYYWFLKNFPMFRITRKVKEV